MEKPQGMTKGSPLRRLGRKVEAGTDVLDAVGFVLCLIIGIVSAYRFHPLAASGLTLLAGVGLVILHRAHGANQPRVSLKLGAGSAIAAVGLAWIVWSLWTCNCY